MDEYIRHNLEDALTDWLAVLGASTSVGVAQVKIETARLIVKNGIYSPDPTNKMLSPKWILVVDGFHLYQYLKQENFSIHFAAAYIRYLINAWDKKGRQISSRPGLIASFYSTGWTPNVHPKAAATERGRQIERDFLAIARKILHR